MLIAPDGTVGKDDNLVQLLHAVWQSTEHACCAALMGTWDGKRCQWWLRQRQKSRRMPDRATNRPPPFPLRVAGDRERVTPVGYP